MRGEETEKDQQKQGLMSVCLWRGCMVVSIGIHIQIKKFNKINNLRNTPPSDYTGVGVEGARPSLTRFFVQNPRLREPNLVLQHSQLFSRNLFINPPAFLR